MRVHNILRSIFIFCVVIVAVRCTRVVATASDHVTEPVVKSYPGAPEQIYSQSMRVLANMGYETPTADNAQFQIVTGWKAVTSGSHYLELFNRQDYAATDGAYYQLMVNIAADGVYSKVEVKTNAKTLAGKLTSSKRLERAFLLRLDDALRSPQILITNVGVQNR